MFTKIMVPLDGSELAEKALPKIVNLVKQLNASLTLLAVVEPGLRYLNPFDTELALTDEASLIEETEQYLTKVRQTLIEFGGLEAEKVRAIVTLGRPVEQIVDLTPFEDIDLLVMTTHARTGLSRLLMGSIATGVLRLVEVPVIMLRPTETKNEVWSLPDALTAAVTESIQQPNLRVLLTLDGTTEAEAVIEPAINLATLLGAEIHLLRVESPSIPVEYGTLVGDYGLYYSNELKKENQERRDEVSNYLRQIQARLLDKGISCSTLVQYGQAPDQIIDYAQEIGANLIAMATHARSRIGQWMLGSVAEQVMSRSHLPVLLVHSAQLDKAHKDKSPTDDIHPAIV